MSQNDLIFHPEENRYETKQKQPVEYITEENFKIEFEPVIERFKQEIEKNNIKYIPQNMKNEVNEYINQRLFDLSISRPKSRVNWGIPVPGSENKQTIYVWFEALLNYITIIGIKYNY